MIVLTLWAASSLAFGAFWCMTGYLLSRTGTDGRTAPVEQVALEVEEQAA